MMMRARIRYPKGFMKIQTIFSIHVFSCEPLIAGTLRCGIEISQQNGWDLVVMQGELFFDNAGASHLGRCVKIKVGVHTDQWPTVDVEQSQGGLSRETTSKRPAGNMGCFTQEDMGLIFTDNGIPVEEDIVLPKPGSWIPPSYVPIFRQSASQKIDLKIVPLLGGDEIGTLFVEEFYHAFLTMVPCIGPVVRQSKPEIEREQCHSIHHGCFTIWLSAGMKQMEIFSDIQVQAPEVVKSHIRERQGLLPLNHIKDLKVVEENSRLPFQAELP
jgi:hypothetical protein